jgi:DNA polymerase-3 subunit alpha
MASPSDTPVPKASGAVEGRALTAAEAPAPSAAEAPALSVAEAFVHLHAHSEYSMLRSTARIPALIKRAQELGQTALALTDHGNMFGMLEFYTAAKKAGLKPIIGCDLYVAPDSRANASYAMGERAWHQLVVLAENETGYRNLLALCSAGHLDGFHQKPRVDQDALRQWGEGLFFLVPNVDSEAGQQFLKGQEHKARESLEFLASLGRDRVFLMVQDHGVEDERTVNKFFLRLHEEDGWNLVAGNDVHYVARKEAEAHGIVLCIEANARLNDADRPRFPSDQYYLRSGEEMAALLGRYPGALENTARLAAACNVEIPFGTLHLPQFPIPPEFSDADAYLAHLAEEGLARRFENPAPELHERLRYELGVMKNMGVAGYMLIVQDFINAAKARNIPVGPGRGSAVGSLVCYAIGITDVDPVRYTLLFERFLNPERVSMPDIDTDFSDGGRQEIIQYVVDKYGAESVAQIVTYGRLKAKAVLKDVARVLGIDHKDVERINKFIPPLAKGLVRPAGDKNREVTYASDISEVMTAVAAGGEPYRLLWDHALSLEGIVRQAGMHAAAVIIAPKAVVNFAPLFKQQGSDQVMIQYDMRFSEDIGLLKMDFLGLRNLSVIQDAIAQIKRNHGVAIDPLKLDMEDPATLAMLGRGQTVGVFQFESGGMQDYLRKLQPSGLEDLIAMNALYRPGPMANIPDYIARKRGTQKPDYYHKDLEPILRETYGVIVYQEQVMQLAQVLAGFTLGGADLLRRAMGKKDEKKMKELKPKFVGGAKERGYDPALAERLWDLLIPFSSYAFNKSHSAAYATVGYQTAYLKANYPAEFMAANMNSEMQDTARLVILLNECRQIGVDVVFPDINRSEATFRAEDGRIVYGLAGVKNVGLQAVERLVEARRKDGPFLSLFDLCRRVDAQMLNRRALESLILAGALPDDLPGNRAQQFAAVETALAWAAGVQADRDRGQVSLFDGGGDGGSDAAGAHEPALPAVDPWPYHEMLEKEKEVLGLYLSGHPLEPYRAELEGFATAPLDPERLRAIPSGTNVILGGMITRLKQRISPKDNRTFAFADLEDFTGKVDVALWSDVFEAVRHDVEVDSMVLIRGALSWDDERRVHKLTAAKVLPLAGAREQLARSVHLRLRAAGLQPDQLEALRAVCEEFPGTCGLVFHVEASRPDPIDILSDRFRVSPGRECFDRLREFAGAGNVWLSSKAHG